MGAAALRSAHRVTADPGGGTGAKRQGGAEHRARQTGEIDGSSCPRIQCRSVKWQQSTAVSSQPAGYEAQADQFRFQTPAMGHRYAIMRASKSTQRVPQETAGPFAPYRNSVARTPQTARATIIFLISAIALAGFRPFGQALAQFMIVWQR